MKEQLEFFKFEKRTWNPKADGFTHINIYSKGRTALGRWLSNFAREPIETADGPFESIEGYWYWLLTGEERLRVLYGWVAKETGKQLIVDPHCPTRIPPPEEVFQDAIKTALWLKAKANPRMCAALCASTLPLAHYYVYGEKVIDAGYEWLTAEWETIRRSFR